MSEVEGIDWKWLNEEKLYKVYRDGRIFSENSYKYMKAIKQKNRDTYMVTLIKNKKEYKTQLHTLIYRLFVSDIPAKMYITFKDGDFNNYKLDNLILLDRKTLVNKTIKNITDDSSKNKEDLGIENIDWKYYNEEKKYRIYRDGRVYSNYKKWFMNVVDNKAFKMMTIGLTVNKKTTTYSVSKIVYNLFTGQIPNDKKVDYNDSNYTNINIDNLYLTDIKGIVNVIDLEKKIKIKNAIKNKLNFDSNEWKINPDFPDYIISNKGKIFSYKINKELENNNYKKYQDSYNSFSIRDKNNVIHHIYVHVLVYCTFNDLSIKSLGNNVIDHINRNRHDNRLENLRLVNRSENSKNRGDIKYKEISQQIKSNNFRLIGKYKNFYFDNYKINEYGDIISINKNKVITHHIQLKYHVVTLYDKYTKKRCNVKVHQLVATVYIQNTNNYKIINHINEIRGDNYYKNLEWTTDKQNIRHSNAKSIVQINLDGKYIDIFEAINDCKEYKKKYIYHCCKHKLKTYNKFIWKYLSELTESDIDKLKIDLPDKLDIINKLVNRIKIKNNAKKLEFNDSHSIKNRDVRKKIVQLSLDNKVLNIFNIVNSAYKHIEKQACGDIINICRKLKNRTTAYGYKWKFYDDLTKKEKQTITYPVKG